MGRRRKNKRRRGWRATPSRKEVRLFRESVLAEAEAREAATRRGMTLTVSYATSGKNGATIPHWRYLADGVELIKYKPTSGGWFCRQTKENGEASGHEEVLELASRVATLGRAEPDPV